MRVPSASLSAANPELSVELSIALPDSGLVQAAVDGRGPLTRIHARRLREIYRSAGWPCHDVIEIDLLAARLLQRVASPSGHETLRVTDEGLQFLAATLSKNRLALSKHETLVEMVANEMLRAGRVTWRGLGLRAQLPPVGDGGPVRWCMARPDVFSIRNTTVQEYVDPIVHEIKVHRSDLLGDLRRPDKRAAYLDLGGECWYVLGCDARGRPIAAADEVPAECGVMLLENQRLVVARAAPRKNRQALPFGVWMALAKATPLPGLQEEEQGLLSDLDLGPRNEKVLLAANTGEPEIVRTRVKSSEEA